MIPRLCPPLSLPSAMALALKPGVPLTHFETAFARLADTKHAIAFPYGRTGLICLLEALGLAQTEVICPSYTCVVVPHAITYSGNQPVFVDCAQGSFLMDWELAHEAVQPHTGAVIATSFFGEPVSVAALDEFRRAHPHVAIIQDCAHSFFCEDGGVPVHKQGIAAIYGLNVSKLMTSVFGGMVTTDDDGLAARLRAVRAARVAPATLKKSVLRRLYLVASRLALSRPAFRAVYGISQLGALDRFVRYYEETKIDMPADYQQGMTGFEAMVGMAQCAAYAGVVAHRRALAARYHAGLSGVAHLALPMPCAGHTWSHYVVRTPHAQAYRKTMAAEGVELGELLDYYIPDMQVYRHARVLDRGVAKSYIGQVLNLPVHRFVNETDAGRIIAALRVER